MALATDAVRSRRATTKLPPTTPKVFGVAPTWQRLLRSSQCSQLPANGETNRARACRQNKISSLCDLLVFVTMTMIMFVVVAIAIRLASCAIGALVHLPDCQVGSIGIETLGIEEATNPRERLLVLRMFRVANCVHEFLVALRTVTIFGRASASPRNAQWVCGAHIERHTTFNLDLVRPSVAEIIVIRELLPYVCQ